MTIGSNDDNKQIIRRLVYELLNNRAYDLIEEYFTPDVEIYSNGEVSIGHDAFRDTLQLRQEKYPTRHYEIRTLLGDSNIICAHWNAVFRLDELPAPVSLDGICICHFNTEKIFKTITFWDELRLLKAIGAVSENVGAYKF